MIGKFRKPSVEVEALQFQGLSNLQEVFEWLSGVIYITAGQDNSYRRPSEYGDELEVKPDAPAFAIVMTQSGYDRVDIGDWIVRIDADHISIYEPLDFAFKFEEVVSG